MDTDTIGEPLILDTTAVACLSSLVLGFRLAFGRPIVAQLMTWVNVIIVAAVLVAVLIGELGLGVLSLAAAEQLRRLAACFKLQAAPTNVVPLRVVA